LLSNNKSQNENYSSQKRLRIIKGIALLYIVAVIFWIWGFAACQYKIFPFEVIESCFQELKAVSSRRALNPQEKYNRFKYAGFKMYDAHFVDNGYLLISRFSVEHKQVIVELVRIKDFATMYTWIPPLAEILKQVQSFEGAKTNDNGHRARHPLLLEDGSLVFNIGKECLAKINKLGEIIWINEGGFHHSIELSPEGYIVAPIRDCQSTLDFPIPVRDDGYAVVNQDGRVIERRSICTILMENGYRGLIFGVGKVEYDRFHLNDVQPIFENRGMAQAGDIALSIRHLSTVLLYRPKTNKVVWLKTGPWLTQHDINLLDTGEYSIFGNDMCRSDEEEVLLDNVSELYIFDPETNSVKTPFSNIIQQTCMKSKSQGRLKILANGDAYIEETDSNRLLRVSREKVRWEFINAATKNKTGALHWCRYLTEGEVGTFWKDQK